MPMELTLLRVAIRAFAAYVYLLVLVRLTGRRAIRHGSAFDFVFALVLGDLVDNAIFAEASAAQFVSATATLVCGRFLVPPRSAGDFR
jgi:uncharacterized membrane protein YcaP (DUF421 family)